MRTLLSGVICLSSLVLPGCKGAEYQTAPVKGKVTFKGQPVTSGQLFFHPAEDQGDGRKNPGKPAFANIEKDGSYRLSTYGEFDGAVVGRHTVMFVTAPGEEEAAEAEAVEGKPVKRIKAAYQIAPDDVERTIVAGENIIDFELVPASKS